MIPLASPARSTSSAGDAAVGAVATEPAATAAERLREAFKAAATAVRRRRGRETQCPGELSFAQYWLLFWLSDGVPRPARELARLAELTPATVAGMLDGLAAAGLVTRTRSDRDRRLVLNSLTDRGRTVIDQRRRRIECRWNAALAEFSDAELDTAAAVLACVRDFFDQFSDEE